MTIIIILIALLIVAAGFVGRSVIMARINRPSVPWWVTYLEDLTDDGMSATSALDLTTSVQHPKDARCRRTSGGCYISRTR